ncbi:hypothetical protein ABZ572_06310 [Streptomyces sp. NPDC018338]|uniref:hypothetical protein n=1 Tax=Streptomyces sp. NPDC018338 TaxID=3157192 RepID=UPI0033DEA809
MPSRSPRAAGSPGSPGKPARETKAGRAKKARRARTAMFLPAGCALALAGWAVWCFGGASAPSTTVAVSVGGAVVLAAGVTYLLLVTGNAGFFGALALVGGLLLTASAADQAAARPEVVECVVVKVTGEVHEAIVDGGLDTTLYHHELRCPGGYPTKMARDRRLAPDGGTIRVAYDPRRRVNPAVEGANSPWLPGFLAVITLTAATAGARRVSLHWSRPEPEPTPRRPRRGS